MCVHVQVAVKSWLRKNRFPALLTARLINISGIEIAICLFFFLVEFLFSNCAGLPTPQDKPIHYPKKLKNQRRAAAISRWSSLLHFHIGNLFYRIDFPGRLVSSHSFFNLQLHQCKAPPPLLNHKKAVFLAAAPHANCKPMICPPNQPCDVLIRCGIVTMWGCPVEGWGGPGFWRDLVISFLCCLKVCPHFFLLKHRQARDSLCLDVLITRLLFLHQREPKGERWGAVSRSVGSSYVLLLSSQRQKVQQIRCQMIFNVKRACLFPWHPLLGTLLHGADTPPLSIQVSSNGTQVGGREGEKENIWRGGRTKIARNGEKRLKRGGDVRWEREVINRKWSGERERE